MVDVGKCLVRRCFDLIVYDAMTATRLKRIEVLDPFRIGPGLGRTSLSNACDVLIAFSCAASVVTSACTIAVAQGNTVQVYSLRTLQLLYAIPFDCMHVESLAATSSRLAVMLRNRPEDARAQFAHKPTYTLKILDYL